MEKKSTGGNGRFLAGFVITVIAVLVFNALFVVYTDPFYQYHAPLGRLPILLEEPVQVLVLAPVQVLALVLDP